jgi:hypothetical protein
MPIDKTPTTSQAADLITDNRGFALSFMAYKFLIGGFVPSLASPAGPQESDSKLSDAIS